MHSQTHRPKSPPDTAPMSGADWLQTLQNLPILAPTAALSSRPRPATGVSDTPAAHRGPEAVAQGVGRVTDTPFEQIGAPWIDGVTLSDALNARALPGSGSTCALHPHGQQGRRRGMPGCHHGHHRSSHAPAGAGRRRNRIDDLSAVRFQVRDRPRRAALRHEGRAGANQSGRRSGGDCRRLGREARWRVMRAKYLLYR